MNALSSAAESSGDGIIDDPLFARIAADIYDTGYSVIRGALPATLTTLLSLSQAQLKKRDYSEAGIGRLAEHQTLSTIRNDEVCWIDGSTGGGKAWLNWTEGLRHYLNCHLFMGLFSFESHFAHYAPGHFYKRHYDAFKGRSNRVLSVVTYLNDDWQQDDCGELVLYQNNDDNRGVRVLPETGTLVVFLSEKFPHEVLPAARHRFSVAGWYRVNDSLNGRVDPPR